MIRGTAKSHLHTLDAAEPIPPVHGRLLLARGLLPAEQAHHLRIQSNGVINTLQGRTNGMAEKAATGC